MAYQRKRTESHEINPDTLFNVLLLLPAKNLCRLRTVCRPWRSLTIDPVFIDWHMSRHTAPLFLVKFQDERMHIHIVDLSGRIIKTMADTCALHKVLFTRLNLACIATDWNRCRVLNPATGAVHVLPQSPAPEHMQAKCVNLSNPFTFFALGRVASTREYKVLRMFNIRGFLNLGQQVFEVYTINCGTSHAQWRARQSPENFVEESSGTVVDGVVYFLTWTRHRKNIPPDCIMSFDLGSEEWRRNLIGPISGDAEALKKCHARMAAVDLAELKGFLVLLYYHNYPYALDLWFLTDFENGVWVKEYSIQPIIDDPCYTLKVGGKPLFVLDDGRLVMYERHRGLLRIYDPETNTSEAVHMRALDSVGMFTGSLLSLQQEGDML